MEKMRSFTAWLGTSLFILGGSLFVLIPISPYNSPFSYRDSGVFLFMGWRILNGELPYIHVWDHKPPIIYYLNALGLGLANNSVWGVWAIELIFLFTAALLGFLLLKKMFGYYSGVLGTFMWLLALVFVIQGGNLATEYTLPFQFGALYLFYQYQQKRKAHFQLFLIGIMGGLAFFTKQTAIGIWLAITIFIAYHAIKDKDPLKRIKEGSLILSGFLVITLMVFGYFFFHGIFDEFWKAAFTYNFSYSIRKVSGFNARVLSLLDISSITRTGLYYYAALGMVLFLFSIKKRTFNKTVLSVLTLGLIAFPIELLLINAPGSTFPHYFMTILPILALFVGVLFSQIDKIILGKKHKVIYQYLLIIATIGLLFFASLLDYRSNTRSLQARTNEPAIQYILERTEPEDSILVWGAETMVNFFSKRPSPTRFVYQYPLYREEFTTEDLVLEFLDDLIENRPKLILNSGGKHEPIFEFPVDSEAIRQKIEQVRSAYEVVDEVNAWLVLRAISQ